MILKVSDSVIQPSKNQAQMYIKFAPSLKSFPKSFNSFPESKWRFLLKLQYISINIQFHS